MPDTAAAAAQLTADPGWARLLAAARRRLEQTGGALDGCGALDGSVSLAVPTEPERLVVIGVTGAHRSAGANRLTVRLAELDGYLRAAHGAGLAELLAADRPLRNRPAEARREAAAREAVLAAARAGRHSDAEWYGQWLDGLRRDGTLTRIIRSGLPFPDVIRALDALPAANEPLPAFADRVLGDTKALTDGPLRGLVLRALAIWQQVPAPSNAEQERALWETVGVVPDDLASQVLVLNLPAADRRRTAPPADPAVYPDGVLAGVSARDSGLVGSWLTSAAEAGVPLRITLYQLRLAPLYIDVDEIFVCENPAVLRAATRLGPGTRPLVCTEGVPAAAVHALLAAAPRATIRWRNDFDWPGIRLTASALDRYPRAVPWRMSAHDYRAAAGSGPALLGTPAATPWDPALCEAMCATGHAVMEERLLDSLMGDLRC